MRRIFDFFTKHQKEIVATKKFIDQLTSEDEERAEEKESATSSQAEDVEYEEINDNDESTPRGKIVKTSSKVVAKKSPNHGKIKEVREGMTEEEEDEFISSLTNIPEGDLKSPQAVMHTLNNIVKGTQEVVKFCAIQETKREEIRAQRDVAIRKIEAMERMVTLYLEKTFDERSAIFAQQFKVVDHALATGDVQMLSMGLSSIQQLAQSSPFKALADIAQVQKNLANPNYEFDI